MKNISDKSVLLALAKRIKAIRKDKGLTQAVCYIDTGINFSRIERGKRDISFTTLFKLSRYFDISLREFFEEDFEVNIFFDYNTLDLIGWQTTDIYQNLSITFLDSVKKNQKLNNNLFVLPKQN